MADEEKNQEENTEGGESTNTESTELTLDSVDTLDPENLDETQKNFIEEHKDELTPEQQEKFGVKAEEKETSIDVDALEPETRSGKPKEEKEIKAVKATTDEDEDDIDPDDEKMVSKVLDKRLKDVNERLDRVQRIEDEAEVNAVIRDNPLLEKYRGAALKYMGHPAYKNIPAINIMAIVSSKDMQKIGAQKEREAAKKVKETQNGGSQVRKQGSGKPDYKNMSKEDFEAAKQAALQGPRN